MTDPYVTQINGRWLVHRHPVKPYTDLTTGYPTAALGVLADYPTRPQAEQHAYRIMEWRDKLTR